MRIISFKGSKLQLHDGGTFIHRAVAAKNITSITKINDKWISSNNILPVILPARKRLNSILPNFFEGGEKVSQKERQNRSNQLARRHFRLLFRVSE